MDVDVERSGWSLLGSVSYVDSDRPFPVHNMGAEQRSRIVIYR